MAIARIKHKGLRELFENGRSRRIGANFQGTATRIMDFLDLIEALDECIGYRDFHPLRGNLKGRYAVTVTGNYRITFTYDDGEVTIEDFTDYH